MSLNFVDKFQVLKLNRGNLCLYDDNFNLIRIQVHITMAGRDVLDYPVINWELALEQTGYFDYNGIMGSYVVIYYFFKQRGC